MSLCIPDTFLTPFQANVADALSDDDYLTVQKFLSRGWNPAQPLASQDPLVQNPLALCRSPKMATLLLKHGADLEFGKYNWSPMLTHSNYRHEEIIAVLIERGANVNIAYRRRKDIDFPFGTTPLMTAAEHGFLGIVRQLLKAGAKINFVDEHNHNALFRALRSGKTEVGKHLLENGSKLTVDILCGPVRHANAEMVRLLMKKGANVNCRFRNFDGSKGWPDGETLLGYAIRNLHSADAVMRVYRPDDYPQEIIEILINAGADVNKPSEWLVVQNKRTKKETVTTRPIPPLRIAGQKGLEKIMDLLWRAGAKGILKQALADCSLDKSAYRNCPNMVKLLIKAGVDVNKPGYQGKRPIELARKKNNVEIVEILKKAGAKD